MTDQRDTRTDDPRLNGTGMLPIEPVDPLILAEVLERLSARQEAVENAFDALARRLGNTPKEGPWAWRSLGPAQTRALFEDLRDWIDWLGRRYDLGGEAQTIPSCWYRHTVAVEELTALMVAWHAAYTVKESAPGDALINWHDRWLWPTLHRLNVQLRVWTKCTGGTHKPDRPVQPLTDNKDFAAFLDEHTHNSPMADSCPPVSEIELGQNEIRAIVDAGKAEALLPDDPRSPVRHRGRWYAIPVGSATDIWTPIDDEEAGRLDAMSARLRAAGGSGSKGHA
jgi:hypothetical protein